MRVAYRCSRILQVRLTSFPRICCYRATRAGTGSISHQVQGYVNPMLVNANSPFCALVRSMIYCTMHAPRRLHV